VVVVLVVLVAALASASGGDLDLGSWDGGGGGGEPDEIWDSGMRDSSRFLISDFSFDFSFSGSVHQDERFGGDLDYGAAMIGVRFGGPRHYVPRYYISTGWGLYNLQYDAPQRADAMVDGPYLGFGLELFPEETVSVGVEYRMHFYFGDDEAGEPLDGGYRRLAVNLAKYW
jgi:hypothetical protein